MVRAGLGSCSPNPGGVFVVFNRQPPAEAGVGGGGGVELSAQSQGKDERGEMMKLSLASQSGRLWASSKG